MQKVDSSPSPLAHRTVFTVALLLKQNSQLRSADMRKINQTKQTLGKKSPLIKDQQWPLTPLALLSTNSNYCANVRVSSAWEASYCHPCLTEKDFYLKCKQPKNCKDSSLKTARSKHSWKMGFSTHGLVDSSNEREKKSTRVSYAQRSIGQRAAMSLPQSRHRCRTRTCTQSMKDSNHTKGSRANSFT